MDAAGLPGGALPGAAAARALRGDRPVDRVRRQPVPAQGPQGRRLPARPDARGDVHPAGEGRVLLVQGPAAVALPDPDQVPRRGAAPRGHPARPRVRHEGLATPSTSTTPDCRPRTTRTATPTSGPSTGSACEYVIVVAPCRARWAARPSEEFLAPTESGEDTYVRCVNGDYAANVEAVTHPGARARSPYDDAPAAHVEDTPDTPTIDDARRRSPTRSSPRADRRTGRRPTR